VVYGWTKFVQAILPPVCVLCGGEGQQPDLDLCSACEADLPRNDSACPLCGEPLAGVGEARPLCGACLRRAPRYHASLCAYRYAYPVDHLVRALKYDGAIVLGRVLGELLVRTLQAGREAPWPDCIVPMPLHPERFNARGYNQSIELGRMVERRLGIPLCTNLVSRIRATREQAALSRKERRKNVRGAFAVDGKLRMKHVAILDDVVTTGSTVSEVARVLRRAGAGHIEVWAIAHAGRT
jgi:ComF family protein